MAKDIRARNNSAGRGQNGRGGGRRSRELAAEIAETLEQILLTGDEAVGGADVQARTLREIGGRTDAMLASLKNGATLAESVSTSVEELSSSINEMVAS